MKLIRINGSTTEYPDVKLGDGLTLPESQQLVYFEFTSFYMFIEYVVAIPQGREMTFIEKLHKPFKLNLWISVGVFVILSLRWIKRRMKLEISF